MTLRHCIFQNGRATKAIESERHFFFSIVAFNYFTNSCQQFLRTYLLKIRDLCWNIRGLDKVNSLLRTPNILEYKKGGFQSLIYFNYLYQVSKKTLWTQWTPSQHDGDTFQCTPAQLLREPRLVWTGTTGSRMQPAPRTHQEAEGL